MKKCFSRTKFGVHVTISQEISSIEAGACLFNGNNIGQAEVVKTWLKILK